MKFPDVRTLLGTAVAALALSGAAQAQSYSFSCLTNNSAPNCATGEDQFSLTVSQSASGWTDFLFQNTGTSASSLTDIYFDWTSSTRYTTSNVQILNGSGVSFSWGASPANLPGSQGLNPVFTANLAADSNAPTQPNGVNPGEQVTFRFLTGYAGAGSDLYAGNLRVGVHAQGFANGGSESLVSLAAPVPEPGNIAMMLAGLAFVGVVVRRRRQA